MHHCTGKYIVVIGGWGCLFMLGVIWFAAWCPVSSSIYSMFSFCGASPVGDCGWGRQTTQQQSEKLLTGCSHLWRPNSGFVECAEKKWQIVAFTITMATLSLARHSWWMFCNYRLSCVCVGFDWHTPIKIRDKTLEPSKLVKHELIFQPLFGCWCMLTLSSILYSVYQAAFYCECLKCISFCPH